ncbi:MAG: hypothetical protein AAB531_04915 [Patescibacteria group bacterium]
MGNRNETNRQRSAEEAYPWEVYKLSGASAVVVSTLLGSPEVSLGVAVATAALSSATDFVVLKRIAKKNKS